MLNDLSWLTFVMVFPGYVLQLSCVALESFMDHRARPLWPRWVGYLNLWIALSGAGGGISSLFAAGDDAGQDLSSGEDAALVQQRKVVLTTMTGADS